MAKDDNQLGTTLFPGGVDVSVPDLTIARPVDTIVESGGAFWRSTDAVTATYTQIGMASGFALGELASGTAIDAGASGYYSITTGGGGETATLPDPTRIGQEISFLLITDGGGDMVITAATRVTFAAASTVLTFADAGDYLVLRSVTTLGGTRWQILQNDGVALT